MKRLKLLLSFGLLISLILAGMPIYAQSAKDAPWLVSVTYQNVGTGPATIMVNFYGEGSATPITFNPLQGIGDGTLAAGAGASFFIGSVSGIPDGWRGNAVISSDQPLVATVVQFSNAPNFKMRLLSNGFQASDASEQYLIATTLLNKFNRTTVFSIQNVENVPILATVRFYDADNNGVLASVITHTIPANSSKYIDMSKPQDTGLPPSTTSFNGSAIVTAVLASDGTTPAKVVAAASEYYINRPVAANFEGLPLSRASTTIYMATALCERFGLDTFYAVQNASLTQTAFIEVVYRDTNGNIVARDGRYQIGPGQKKSIATCSPSDGTNMSNFTGSAVIYSYSASTGTNPGAPIVAIGKAQTSLRAPTPITADAFTAFMGEPAGVSKIACPFIRWANNENFVPSKPGKQRTYIAIQNLENTTIKVVVTYKDRNGNTVGTPQVLTIPPYSKANSDPYSAGAVAAGASFGMISGEFGYYTDGGFGAGAIIEAHPDNPTAKFIAIVRANNAGASEDYNGPPAP
ncbi:MAG: hypothetical protein QXS54_10120 [Candidatus Methanomethylicaceae archaeon]